MMQYVQFDSGPNTLRGMLHLPDADRPLPAVLFCHGFTGNRIEAHFLFVTIARRLEAAGIASLRFDFAGSGESDGEFADMTMSGEVGDAKVALDFLRARPEIDAARVGVVGLSLGGGVAALLAGRSPNDIRALALMSAVAEPGRILSFVRTGKFEMQLAQRDYMDWDGLMVRRAFLQDLDDLHPAEEIKAYARPVLIIHGGEDATVPPSEARTFRAACTAAGADTILEILDGADHTFSSLQHTEKVCELLSDFFSRQL